jgi:hypothetical protein
MTKTFASICALLLIGCIEPAWSQHIAEPFKGYPVLKARKQRYDRNIMSTRQKSAYRYELKLIEHQERVLRENAAIQAEFGTSAVLEPLPLVLNASDAALLKKYRGGFFTPKQAAQYEDRFRVRLDAASRAVSNARELAVQRWRRANPVLAAHQDQIRQLEMDVSNAQGNAAVAEMRAQEAEFEAEEARSAARRAEVGRRRVEREKSRVESERDQARDSLWRHGHHEGF